MLSREPVVQIHKHKDLVLALHHWAKVDLPVMEEQEEYPTIRVPEEPGFLQMEQWVTIQRATIHLQE